MGPYENEAIDLNLPTGDFSGNSGGSTGGNKSLAAAIVPVIGSAISGLFSYLNQNAINRHNEQLARQQNAWNLMQWQRENWYNDPANQVARLRAAGLNPGLLMSNGVENIAAQSPEMVSSQSHATAQIPNVFSNFAQDYKTAQLLDAQRENIEADTRQKNANAGFYEMETNISGVKFKIMLKNGEKLSDAQLANLSTATEKLQHEIDLIDQEKAIKVLEEKKIRYYIDNIQPEELRKLQADIGLTEAQTKEILELLPTKILLNKAMANQANASARLSNANAEFQERLNSSDRYVQEYINSVEIDNAGKLVSMAVNAGEHRSSYTTGGQLLGYNDKGYSTRVNPNRTDAAVQSASTTFRILGQMLSVIFKF